MQIDPRVSKSMLDMQLLNNMSATTQTGTADAFSGLLEQVGQLETDDAVTQENSGDVTRDENGLLWLQLGPRGERLRHWQSIRLLPMRQRMDLQKLQRMIV